MDNLWLDQASAARNELNRLWKVVRTETREQLEELKAPRGFIDYQYELMSAGDDEEYVEERQLEAFAVHQALEKAAELRAQTISQAATTPSQTIWGSENSENNVPHKRFRTVAKLAKLASLVEDHDPEPTEVSAFAVQSKTNLSSFRSTSLTTPSSPTCSRLPERLQREASSGFTLLVR